VSRADEFSGKMVRLSKSNLGESFFVKEVGKLLQMLEGMSIFERGLR